MGRLGERSEIVQAPSTDTFHGIFMLLPFNYTLTLLN